MEIEEQKRIWTQQRIDLKDKLIPRNTQQWQNSDDLKELRFVGGVDISFVKSDPSQACAAYVVCDLDNHLEVIHQSLEMIRLEAPYVPGFLAFREAEPLKQLILKCPIEADVIFVDGNGILHPEKFGLACHLGVLVDLPCIGVAKNIFQMEDLIRDEEHKRKIEQQLNNIGDDFELRHEGQLLGLALKNSTATNPVFVSIGNKIDLMTAKKTVIKCSKFRVPEPIRQADIRSREFIRNIQQQS